MAVLADLQNNPGASVAEIATRLGIPRVDTAAALVQLENDEPPRVIRGAPRRCAIAGLVVSTWTAAQAAA